MKRFILFLLAVSAFAADGTWISLFDGKTLAGWQGFRGPANPVWIVKDGAITVNREGVPGTPGNGNSSLRTEREFGNFELEWEWKNAPGGNSGLFYRATEEEERPQWTAVEYQLLDGGAHPDGEKWARPLERGSVCLVSAGGRRQAPGRRAMEQVPRGGARVARRTLSKRQTGVFVRFQQR